MNMLSSQVKAFSDQLLPKIPGFKDWCEAVICAPSVLLPSTIESFKNTGIGVGAQNMSQHISGAYTGEISAGMLSELGVGYVIVGHSERRAYYYETDEMVKEKAHAALSAGLRPIVCVGESFKQREIGVTNDFVTMQVKAALTGISKEQVCKVIIAYEPIWAIGTGMTATPDDAQNVCAVIRKVLAALYDNQIAQAMTIQYGGSMNDNNAADLLAQPDIDGGLIGGASLKPESFAAIVNAANQ